MTKSREWFSSRYSRNTELYIETVERQNADGMLRPEHTILATVMPRGYHWNATIWRPGDCPDIPLPYRLSKEAAMQSVLDYLQQHEDPELL